MAIKRLAGIALLAVGVVVAVAPYREEVTFRVSDGPLHARASCRPAMWGAFQGRFEGGWLGYAPDDREVSVGPEWCDRSRARRQLGVGVILVAGGVGLVLLDRRQPPKAEPEAEPH